MSLEAEKTWRERDDDTQRRRRRSWLFSNGAATIAGSLIGAAALILTTVPYSAFLQDYNLVRPSQRQLAFAGSWTGTVAYTSRPGSTIIPEHAITVRLDVSWWRAVGEAQYKHPEFGRTKLHLAGGFMDQQHLRLHHRNQESSQSHFGSMIFRLDAVGRKLDGVFVAKGRYLGGLLSGTINLVRSE